MNSTAMKKMVFDIFDEEILNTLTSFIALRKHIEHVINIKTFSVCREKKKNCTSCFRCMELKRFICKKYHSRQTTEELSPEAASIEIKKRLIYEALFGFIQLRDVTQHKWTSGRDFGHNERLYILQRKVSQSPIHKWLI